MADSCIGKSSLQQWISARPPLSLSHQPSHIPHSLSLIFHPSFSSLSVETPKVDDQVRAGHHVVDLAASLLGGGGGGQIKQGGRLPVVKPGALLQSWLLCLRPSWSFMYQNFIKHVARHPCRGSAPQDTSGPIAPPRHIRAYRYPRCTSAFVLHVSRARESSARPAHRMAECEKPPPPPPAPLCLNVLGGGTGDTLGTADTFAGDERDSGEAVWITVGGSSTSELPRRCLKGRSCCSLSSMWMRDCRVATWACIGRRGSASVARPSPVGGGC